MGGRSGLEGFILFLKGDELGGFGLGRQGNHFCLIVFSVDGVRRLIKASFRSTYELGTLLAEVVSDFGIIALMNKVGGFVGIDRGMI